MKRLPEVAQQVMGLPTRAWSLLRALSGDDSYERYREHWRRHHPASEPLDRRDFYLREQERRYSAGPTSCC